MSNIASKISEVMEKVNYLQKDGNVSYKNTDYDYLSEEKVTSALNKAFREVGLVIYPTDMEFSRLDGKFADIKATYRIADVDSDEYIEITALGEGMDHGDKKVNKAMTSSYKYALRQSMMIYTAEDPDHISNEELKEQFEKAKEVPNKREKALNKIRNYYKKHQEDALPVILGFMETIGLTAKNLRDIQQLNLNQLKALGRKLDKEVKDGDKVPNRPGENSQKGNENNSSN